MTLGCKNPEAIECDCDPRDPILAVVDELHDLLVDCGGTDRLNALVDVLADRVAEKVLIKLQGAPTVKVARPDYDGLAMFVGSAER